MLDLSSTSPSLLVVTWVSALPVEHLDNWFFWEMTFLVSIFASPCSCAARAVCLVVWLFVFCVELIVDVPSRSLR